MEMSDVRFHFLLHSLLLIIKRFLVIMVVGNVCPLEVVLRQDSKRLNGMGCGHLLPVLLSALSPWDGASLKSNSKHIKYEMYISLVQNKSNIGLYASILGAGGKEHV